MGHTPGSWKVGEPVGGDEKAQAFEIVQPRKHQDLSICEVNIQMMMGTEEALQKATLIAATPDMLRELQEIAVGWENRTDRSLGLEPLNPWEKERFAFLKATIARATTTKGGA